MRFSDYFEATADKYPDASALVDGNISLDFSTVKRMLFSSSNALLGDSRVRPGAHIAVLSHNHYWVPILNLAIDRADMVTIAAFVKNSIDANEQVLDFMDCNVIFFHSDYEKEIGVLKQRLNKVVLCICVDKSSTYGPFLDEWMAEHSVPQETGMEDPNGLMSLRPTGGTTGPAKGVLHLKRSGELILINILDSAIEMEAGARYLAVAPLSHAGGVLAMITMIAGGCVVVHSDTDPDSVVQAIGTHKITSLFLPPTLLYGLMATESIKDIDTSSLKTIRVGAAPISSEKYREAVLLFGPVIYESYGQTEIAACLINKGPEDYLLADGSFDEPVLRSMGKPSKYVRVAVMDETGKQLPAGKPGELVVQSSMTMHEYYKNPEETSATIRDGWVHTGDVVTQDERGYITMVDRIKDIIISGGFNVYPAQVESVLQGHPAVLDCAVVGVPDDKWGEAVKAVVQLKENEAVSADELISLCRDALGPVYTPKSVEFRERLPRSPAGKILRREIRAEYWKETDRSV